MNRVFDSVRGRSILRQDQIYLQKCSQGVNVFFLGSFECLTRKSSLFGLKKVSVFIRRLFEVS